MKIIIVGAGEVGFHLAKVLAQEQNDIIVIDRKQERLERVSESLDVMTVEGSGSQLSTLEKVGVSDTDLLIAVTSIDEVNLTSCLLAHKLGAKKTIVRVNDPEFLSAKSPLNPEDFGVDLVIYPEGLAAHEIVQLIRRSSATDVLDFADGRIQLIGIRIEADSPLVGKKLRDVSAGYQDIPFRVVAIQRGIKTIIPFADDTFRKGDQAFVISKTEQVPEMLRMAGKETAKFERVMILGGGRIGQHVAEELEEELTVKLIESSKETSMKLADSLRKTMVIQGEGKDIDLLATEGIMDMDVYIATTRDEEDNIISCLMAKHLGVKKTIAHVEKLDYIPLANTIGIDALVNKKLSAATAILKFIRKGEIVSVASLHGVDAEVIEMVAQKGSRVTKKQLQDLEFPEGAIVGCVIHNGSVAIPVGATKINPQDRVVVFCLPGAIKSVEKFFS
ncbi:MAG: Trk system potassium transporter TrkA [Ignavibacteriae bacterium]|nr:Trk system potassium transporter TrkA [Ignavibacteriota bacterium]